MARTLPTPVANLSPLVMDMKSLGRLVRNRRAQSAMRIDDAASMLGVSKDVLSRLENGHSVGMDKVFVVLQGMGLSLILVDKQRANNTVNCLDEQSSKMPSTCFKDA